MNNLSVFTTVLVFTCGFLATTQVSIALDLANFRTCVSSAGTGSVCTLDPNWSGGSIVPWSVSSPISVQRAVTAKGHPSYPGQVSLLRSAAIENIMDISSSVSGITVDNLVFDGNSSSFAGGSYVDLNFQTGTWNNYVTNSIFINAPAHALNINHYTYVMYCTFDTQKYVGVLTFNETANNTNLGIYNSYFTKAGTNAVYFSSGTTNSIIYDSDFYENHNSCAWSSNGGQILLDATTSAVTVQNNVVDGNYAYCLSYPESSAGLEGYGSSHSVTGNIFKKHRWFGMYFTGSTSVTISSNTVELNNRNGINLSGRAGSGACPSSSTYTISSNIIRNNSWYGIYAEKSGCTSGPDASTITLSGNTFGNNAYGDTSLTNP